MAPVSIALHGVAITTILLVSGQRVVSREAPPDILVFHPPAAATPVPAVVAIQPPRGTHHVKSTSNAGPSLATPKPFVQPTTDDPSTLTDDIPPDPPGDPAAPTCESNCGTGPAGDPNGTDTSTAVIDANPLRLTSSMVAPHRINDRSEERRVGKECRSRWS